MSRQAKARVGIEDTQRFMEEVLSEDWHAKRVASLASATLGVVTSGSLMVHAIGQGLAHAQGLLPKHAIKQVDRLLSNQGIEVWEAFADWVPHVVGARREVVVALDWTSFARDDQATVALSLLTGHGRATPLLWKTVRASALQGQQTGHEDALLVRLREVLPAGVAVTVVADRGIADGKLWQLLSEELGFGYVMRLRGNVYVTSPKGERRRAAEWVGAGGRARILRGATVTDYRAYTVGTVVCLQGKDMAEPWCLVASDPQASAKTLVRYYAKRWGIEASFRDIKDLRFGMGLASVRVSRPGRRDRLLLLSAFAIALLSLLGAAGEALGYDRMLKANTVKRRTHSLFRQGCLLYDWLPNMPEKYLQPLMARFTELVLEQPLFNKTFATL